jgi:hypothetical protein
MPKFRELPKEVEAILWDGSPGALAAIERLTGQTDLRGPGDSLTVDGPEGPSAVRLGAYVVMDSNGVHGCPPERFVKRYEAIIARAREPQEEATDQNNTMVDQKKSVEGP